MSKNSGTVKERLYAFLVTHPAKWFTLDEISIALTLERKLVTHQLRSMHVDERDKYPHIRKSSKVRNFYFESQAESPSGFRKYTIKYCFRE